ncbi:MAG: AarF/UbiB family protein [Actinomycetia bacterium]|nr:AarF/UbiB family protein [Actinomycetes bacterium]
MPAVTYLILAIPMFILFAWVARRLLGVTKLSMTKTVVAAFGGLLVGDVLARILLSRDMSQDQAILIGMVIGLIATMVIIITFEAFANPARSPVRSEVSNPVVFIQQKVSGVRRSTEIARIANRHGLASGFGLAMGQEISPEDATEYGIRLREALQDAGGIFVKLGQLLATRPDVIPPQTADELGLLNQDVEPAPRSEVEPELSAAFGETVDQVFAEFDWSPIGAGSLGQVYKATLASGEKVVVKVRRPNIEDAVNRDLRIAVDLASFAEQQSSEAAQLGVMGLAEQFSRQLREEMDYRIEARNTIECGVSLARQGHIATPTVFEDLSGETVLVISLLPGETLGRNGIVGGEHGRELADTLFRAEVNAMLAGERFHADPHPGNVMVMPDGNLGLIDFGSADRLDAFERAAVTEILTGLALNDPTMLRSAALSMGMGDGDVDPGHER